MTEAALELIREAGLGQNNSSVWGRDGSGDGSGDGGGEEVRMDASVIFVTTRVKRQTELVGVLLAGRWR